MVINCLLFFIFNILSIQILIANNLENNGLKLIEISSKANVKLNKNRWKGKNDISFKYNCSIEENFKLKIFIEVTDDFIIRQDTNDKKTDHVEIWIADPGISKMYEETLESLNDAKTYFIERIDNDGDNIYINVINNIENNLKYYKSLPDFKYASHLAFIEEKCYDLSRNYFVSNISFSYQITNQGYNFTCEIPLNGIIDYNSKNISELYVLIEIIDYDDSKTKKIIASSDKRIYKNPKTFNKIKFKKQNLFLISQAAEIGKEIYPYGYYKYDEKNKYEYFYNDGIYSGGYEIKNCIPGEFKKFELPSKYENSPIGFEIRFIETYLLLTRNKTTTFFDLKKNISAGGHRFYKIYFCFERDEKYYLVFTVSGSSLGLGGLGECGTGEEANLMLVILDKNLKLLKIQSELFQSCFENIYYDENQYLSLTKNSIEILCDTLDGPVKFEFNTSFPENGIKAINIIQAED